MKRKYIFIVLILLMFLLIVIMVSQILPIQVFANENIDIIGDAIDIKNGTAQVKIPLSALTRV